MTALNKNLLAVNPGNLPENFFVDKLETFLVCMTISEKLEVTFQDRPLVSYALFWIYQTLQRPAFVQDLCLLCSALPEILRQPFPLTEKIREVCIQTIPTVIQYLSVYNTGATANYNWNKVMEFKRLLQMLKTFDSYAKK